MSAADLPSVTYRCGHEHESRRKSLTRSWKLSGRDCRAVQQEMKVAFETILSDEMVAKYAATDAWGRTHCDYFDEAVRRNPSQTAVVDRDVRWSYAELERQVLRAAHSLLDHGIQSGDVVGISLPNWKEFLVTHYALSRIGAVTLPLLLDYRRGELEFMLNFAEAKAIVCCDTFREFSHSKLIKKVVQHTPSLRAVFVVGHDCPDGMIPYAELVKESVDSRLDLVRLAQARPRSTDVMELVFTSGTTGNPKGILHTHDTFMSAARRVVRDFRVTDDDIVLGLSPLAHQHGMLGHLAPSIVAGATTLLLERFRPSDALTLIQREKATVVVGVPSHAHMLLDVNDSSKCDTRSWRLFFCAGATLPIALAERIARQFGCRITSAYGMSEIGYCTYSRIDDPFEVAAQTCGRPGSGIDVQILDDDQNPCETGTVGEIALRGPNLMAGYLKNIQTMRALMTHEGYFRSGDMGALDQSGNLRVVGRQKDMILRGGANIYPIEVEELLLRWPRVANVAIVGYPDDRLGERVAAFIVTAGNAPMDLGELTEFLRDKLASYKIPDRLIVVDELPMTATGKIRKIALVAQLMKSN